MADARNHELQTALAALQAKNAQLDEKLRSLEQSYTVDKRTVYVAGAALSVLVVAFSGYSLTQMPQKVMERLEASVATRTGKTIDERMKAVDETLVQAREQLAQTKSSGAPAPAVSKSIEAIEQRLTRLEAAPRTASAPAVDAALTERVAQLERAEKRRPTAGPVAPASAGALAISATSAGTKRLRYSELGYVVPDGFQLDCDAGAWVTGLRFYTNKDAKFAGFSVECKLPSVATK